MPNTSPGCIICGQSAHLTKNLDILSFDLKDKYRILRCSYCGVKKTDPVPEDMSVYYKLLPYNQQQNKLFHYLKSLLIRYEIERIACITKTKAFLDLGSGSGEFADQLDKRRYDVVACDTGNQRPFYIQDRKNIPYLQFDFERYAFIDHPGAQKRTVILRHVLEHIKDPYQFLKSLTNSCADHFYIALPNTDCREQRLFKEAYNMWYAPYHLWHFNKSSLTHLLDRIGVDVLASGYDTIPTLLTNIYRHMLIKQYPSFLKNIFSPTATKVALTTPGNIFFPNNVVWMIGKVR